jgi:hypothetical protein
MNILLISTKIFLFFFINFFFFNNLLKKFIKNIKNDELNFLSSIFIIISIFFLCYVTNSLIKYYIPILGCGCLFFIRKTFFLDIYKIIIKNYGIILLLTFLLSLIILIPLTSFDARSIWFFHSKIIFYENKIFSNIWFESDVLFSQVHYPKINAVISAYISKLLLIWNYHLSKISIFLLLLPIIFFFKINFKKNYFFLIILLLILFFRSDLINGYFDSIIALYSTAILILIVEIDNKKKKNLVSFFFLLSSILIQIKDEGIVIFLIILFTLLIFRNKEIKAEIVKKNKFVIFSIIIFIISLILFVQWKYFITKTNVTSLFFGQKYLIDIKINLENFNTIIYSIFFTNYIIVYFILLLFLIKFSQIYFRKKLLIILFFITIYILVLICVYLLSPLDIKWHLGSSIGRVLYTVKFLILAFIIKYAESRPTINYL